MENYIEINRNHWDKSVDPHWDSDFYDVARWLEGASSLKEIELGLLPVLEAQRVLHLQCHFGQDSLSLSRMGANVTGIDLSGRAIERARELCVLSGLSAEFVQSDVYTLPDVLDAAAGFDVVYTTWGTIGWLPDLARWSEVVAHYLKPGGVFVMAEFHPMVWMFNHDRDAFEYSYFNRGPIVESGDASYAAMTEHTQEVGWNHSIGDVLSALLGAGLRLDVFEEYDYSPWSCFHDAVEVGPDRFQLEGLEGIVPMSYGLRATRPC